MATMLAPAPATTAIPFSRTLNVEFRKSYNTRAGLWLLIVIAALVLVAELITAIVTGVKKTDIDWETFSEVAGFITSVLLPVLGIMLVTSEWSQRTALVTFTLEPRRARVIGAKLGVGILLTLATVIIAIALGAVFNALHGVIAGSADWHLGVRAVVGFTIAQALAMIGGFALAALFLNTPAAIVVFFAYKWMLPVLFGIAGALIGWFQGIANWIDFQAAQQVLYDGSGAKAWGHLIVSGIIWVVVPLAIGLRRIMRAEVK